MSNIAVVSDAVLPFHNGGKETRIHFLTQELMCSGHDVHIYTMKWWDQPEKVISLNGVTYHALSKNYPLYHGSRRSIKQAVFFGVACLKLSFKKFDVLEVDHMPFFPLFSTKLASFVKRRPLYATWHEVWGKEYWQEYLGPLGVVAYWVEKLSVRLPDRIIAASDNTRAQLLEKFNYRGPICVVNNGIDLDAIKLIARAKEVSDVIFVGRLLPHKNVHVLLEAVAILRVSQPAIKALIIGSGPELGRLQQMVARYGLEKNVVLKRGIADSSQVLSLMKSSRVLVLPSTREGFGIVVLEAFACGLPVVTIDHMDNAAQYLINPSTGIVCQLSASQIADSIDRLLARRSAKVRFGLRREAGKFQWREIATQLIQVYEK